MTLFPSPAEDAVPAANAAGLPIIPWLPATLRRAWRAPGVLQIGADASRAVVLRNVSTDVAAFLAGLDGTRTLRQVLEASDAHGLHGPIADRYRAVLRTLTEKGLVIDLADELEGRELAQHPLLLGALAPEVHGRALGNLRASPAATMRARAIARTVIVGDRRIAPAIAAILAASGVRHIAVVQSGVVTPSDLVPGGPRPQDLGRPRAHATHDALARAAVDVETGAPRAGDQPDLVILADGAASSDARVRMLMRTGTPFLPVGVRERRVVVGPFVIPGESSCLACQDAIRRDLDQRWAMIDAQLRHTPTSPGDGGETPLVMIGAGLAAAQILQWIDNERLPETINATLELSLPDLVLERRYWPRHEACSCQFEVH
ncbi:ThiF family adenylyltransferase [Cumulibacter soli]|uniref:ThiF family adenylyltransferase n=1 Tax=Cumulibacter soli TaxID=2546344 RepID=UPI0010689F07|nr:ThiF family adenylyltransferase [Cumulibacter soli]